MGHVASSGPWRAAAPQSLFEHSYFYLKNISTGISKGAAGIKPADERSQQRGIVGGTEGGARDRYGG
ncbi:hypothetical protein EOD23_14990 [Mesorhizobium sp. USDA-HM6]|nr:hypothetical protein EOD23_14990 [Mesorhizobium sp. USDA-HM6]